MEQLQAAKKVVQDVLKNKVARVLFGQPVDTSVHTTYLKVIKKPMDLGTVLSRFPIGEHPSRGRERGSYRTVQEVLRDVNLVWTNCLEYNCQPQDEPTRKLCDDTRKLFAAKWQAAGLPLDSDKETQNAQGLKRGKAAIASEQQGGNGAGVPSAYYISPGSTYRCAPVPLETCLRYEPVECKIATEEGWKTRWKALLVRVEHCLFANLRWCSRLL